MAYVPQTAFIFNETVRNNILFGMPWDADRYQRVIEAASMGPDLALLQGDLACLSWRLSCIALHASSAAAAGADMTATHSWQAASCPEEQSSAWATAMMPRVVHEQAAMRQSWATVGSTCRGARSSASASPAPCTPRLTPFCLMIPCLPWTPRCFPFLRTWPRQELISASCHTMSAVGRLHAT